MQLTIAVKLSLFVADRTLEVIAHPLHKNLGKILASLTVFPIFLAAA
jgi:hypothetical protein